MSFKGGDTSKYTGDSTLGTGDWPCMLPALNNKIKASADKKVNVFFIFSIFNG
jgi:hypothetical protein